MILLKRAKNILHMTLGLTVFLEAMGYLSDPFVVPGVQAPFTFLRQGAEMMPWFGNWVLGAHSLGQHVLFYDGKYWNGCRR